MQQEYLGNSLGIYAECVSAPAFMPCGLLQ